MHTELSQTFKEQYSIPQRKNKIHRVSKTIMYYKGTSGGITFPYFKLYYRPRVLITA